MKQLRRFLAILVSLSLALVASPATPAHTASLSSAKPIMAEVELLTPSMAPDSHRNAPPPAPPSNDLFANAVTVSTTSVTAGTTVEATLDTAATCGSANVTAPGVWYHVVGDGGLITANTCSGLGYDTKISVYTDNGVSCVGGNDDGCGLGSSVSWASTAGKDYYILVHGYASATGTFTLSVTSQMPLENDICANALQVGAMPYTHNTNTMFASTSPDDPLMSCTNNQQNSNTVWYAYTPGTDGLLTASTAGSNYDTVLCIHTGPCGSLTEVACNDDATGLQSLISDFTVTAGTLYHIEVADYGMPNGGNLTLNLSGPPPGNPQPGAPYLTSIARQTPATSPTNADTLIFRATFSEDVQNLLDATADFTVDGATTATVTGVTRVNLHTYDVTVSGGDLASFNGTVGLNLAAGQNIMDLTGDALDLAPVIDPDETYIVDNIPLLTSIVRSDPTTSPTNADTLIFLATFNEVVKNVDENDFVVTGTTAAITVTPVNPGNDNEYFITVQGGDLSGLNGTVGLDLDASQDIIDLTGNAISTTEPAVDEIYDLDNTTAAVKSILRQDPLTSPTHATSVTFRVTFADDVQNVDTPDFSLAKTGTATGTIDTRVVQSASVYDIVITGVSGNGTLNLNFAANNDISDLTGNPIGGNPAVETEETYTIDTAAPVVTFGTGSIPPAEGANLTTGPLQLVVLFSENVLGDGSQHAANSRWNYLLVRPGPNQVFDTAIDSPGICDSDHVVSGDDEKVDILDITYDAKIFAATLTIDPLFAPLANGQYRLYACGVQSIWDLSSLALNNGTNMAVNFSVFPSERAESGRSRLPATGFAPGQITLLPPQSVPYTDLGNFWLEIPRLGVKLPIVGIPQKDGGWDVSWLGTKAGWLEGSAYPSWKGNSVLTGHVWNADNTAGPFRYLNTLWWGDKVIVHLGAQQYVYEVRTMRQVAPTNVSAMMKHEELPWLTLVTCKDYEEKTASYRYRILVRAVLVEVK